MGPFKCPDCGVWWAGFEHRCREAEVTTRANVTVSGTVRCTCPPNRGPQHFGSCPIHDVQITYTTTPRYGTNAIAGPTTSMPRGVS